MNTATSSVILTILFWYIVLGLYNLVFFSLYKKLQESDWKQFLIDTLGILVVYIIVNVLSIYLASELSVAMFVALNLVLVFGAGYLYSRYIMKLEGKTQLIYSAAFLVIFNLYWYVLAGIL